MRANPNLDAPPLGSCPGGLIRLGWLTLLRDFIECPVHILVEQFAPEPLGHFPAPAGKHGFGMLSLPIDMSSFRNPWVSEFLILHFDFSDLFLRKFPDVHVDIWGSLCCSGPGSRKGIPKTYILAQ